ncbi:hypothetical protein [Microbacterium halophytorum]|uniref:hypothetical protein n=1 Tax=Microbacterium halophytorum TaxID=2067568 RepID=UPI00131A272D|nr:hypothetical protein [Microbacterium halophytorum]
MTTDTPSATGSIRLPRHEAEWLIRGALAAASTDDVTPMLRAVHVTVAGGRVTATATDRYRVHQLYVTIDDAETTGQFLVDVQHAKRLLRSWHTPAALYREQVVVLSWTDPEPLPKGHTGRIPRSACGTITFEILADGNDPDADRLTYEVAQVRLTTPGFFDKLTTLFANVADDVDGDGDVLRDISLDTKLIAATKWLNTDSFAPMRFTIPRKGATKAKPLIITNGSGTARALIQPSLLHSAVPYGEATGTGDHDAQS